MRVLLLIRLHQPTWIGWGVGYDNSVVRMAYVVHGFEVDIGSKSRAIRQGRNQIWEKMPMYARWLIFSET